LHQEILFGELDPCKILELERGITRLVKGCSCKNDNDYNPNDTGDDKCT